MRLWPRLVLALILSTLALVATLVSALYWSAHNGDATAWWIKRVPGLQVTAPRGHLMGDFAADEVTLRLPSGAQLQLMGLQWTGLQFDRADAPSAWLKVQLARLHARSVLWTPPTQRPQAAVPKHLRLPLQLSIGSISADELRLPGLGNEPLRGLQASVSLGQDAGDAHRVNNLRFQWGRLQAQGSGQVLSDESMAVQGELLAKALFEFPNRGNATATAPSPAPWKLTLQAEGPLPQLRLKTSLRSETSPGPAPRGTTPPTSAQLDASAELRPFERWPLSQLHAQTQQLNLSEFHALAPQTAITGGMELRAPSAAAPLLAQLQLRNEEAGVWNEGRLPVRQLNLQAQGPLQAEPNIKLERFEIDLGSSKQPAGRITGQGHLAANDWALQTEWSSVLPEALDQRAAAMSLNGKVEATGRWPDSGSSSTAPQPRTWQTMALRLQAQLRGQLTRTALGTAAPASVATNTTDTPSRRDVQISLDLQGQALQWKLDKLLAQAGTASLNMRGTAERQAADQPWRIAGEAQLREFDPRPWWRQDPAQRLDAALAQTPSSVNADARWDVQLPPRPESGSTMNWIDLWRGQAALNLQPSQLAGVALQGTAQWRHQGKDPAALQVALDAEGNRVSVDAAPKSLAQPGAASPLNLTVDAPELQRLSPLWRLLGGPVEAGAKQAPLSGALKAQASLSWPGQGRQDLLNSRSSGQVSAQGVRVGPWSLAQGTARWQVQLAPEAPLQAQIELQQAALRGLTLNRLSMDVTGPSDAHQIKVHAESPIQPPRWVEVLQGTEHSGATASTDGPEKTKPTSHRSVATLEAHGGFLIDASSRAIGWRGDITQLVLGSSDPHSTPWLRSSGVALSVEGLSTARPTSVSAPALKPPAGPSLTLSAGRAELPGAALRWERMQWRPAGPGVPALIEANAELEPLSVAPLLARLQPDFGWGGDLRVGAHLKLKSSPTFEADVLIERLSGDLNVTEDGLTQALGLSDLRLALNARNGVWNFSQGLAGNTLGVMAGLVVARTSPSAVWPAADDAIDGVIELQVANLGTWGTWVPTGWRLGGQLRTSATIGGRFGAPEVTGRLQGSDLSVRNVVEGVAISDGEVNLSLQGDVARIEKFTARAGKGSITLAGQAELGAKRQAQLTLTTEQFQLLGRVDRRIVTSGQAQLQLTEDSVALAGRFAVDEGLIDISKLDAPRLGEDVVVTRASTPPAPTPEATTSASTKSASSKVGLNGKATNVNLDLQVDLGEKLRLRGRGLNTGLAGQLKLSSPNNKLAINGTVRTVGGTYAAYQQKLTIDRGLITFSGNPGVARLDIEATRPNTDVRVGVAVTGTTVTPRVRLFSEPDMPEIDKLSWLVLGRESGGVGGTDLALLQRAALGLLSGEEGGATDQVLQNLGLDSLSLRQSNTSVGDTKETIVSLGKQVSRDWYVGYERSLNATAGNWQLIYRLAQRFTLRAQSGLEHSLDVIWTWRWQ